MYDKGKGVEKNFDEALKWYRKAANQGYSKAQINLAFMYYYGKGVVSNYASAVTWFRKAAYQGDVQAYYYLGNCYLEGIGVSRNKDLAISWFLKAAQMGHYRAISFFRSFAEKGYAEAQVIMGLLNYQGQGIPRNTEMAVRWLEKASLKGHSHAQAYLDAICHETPKACE